MFLGNFESFDLQKKADAIVLSFLFFFDILFIGVSCYN